MVFAWSMPDIMLNALVSALLGSLFAATFVAFLTQRWIERREQRNRLHALKLQLYLDAIDLILDNELALAKRGAEGETPPIELQTKQINIHHRLKLLGPQNLLEVYDKYNMLVFQSTAHPLQHRPENPHDVVNARDELRDMMANDLQCGCPLNEQHMKRNWIGRLFHAADKPVLRSEHLHVSYRGIAATNCGLRSWVLGLGTKT